MLMNAHAQTTAGGLNGYDTGNTHRGVEASPLRAGVDYHPMDLSQFGLSPTPSP